MAKSKAVMVDVTNIGDNFRYVKYTYVYVDGEDAKRKIVREKDFMKGFHQIGKTKFTSVPFSDKTGGMWTSESVYQRD